MKQISKNFNFEALSRWEMKFIIGGTGNTSTCYVDECKADSKVTCDGDCSSSGSCAWCESDPQGTRKCCLA